MQSDDKGPLATEMQPEEESPQKYFRQVRVIGVGATGAATIKDQDCNRRLNAAVAWRMDRKDVAFNIMCQDDSFRAAAATTKTPCDIDVPKVSANDANTQTD